MPSQKIRWVLVCVFCFVPPMHRLVSLCDDPSPNQTKGKAQKMTVASRKDDRSAAEHRTEQKINHRAHPLPPFALLQCFVDSNCFFLL